MRSLARKLLLSTVIVVTMLGLLFLFKIKTVDCTLGGVACPGEVTQALNIFVGRSFFFTDLNLLFNQEPTLSQYRLSKVQKKLPGTLIFELQPYLTGYQLYFSDQDKTLTVDSQRGLLEQKSETLPTITTQVPLSDLEVEGKIDPDIHQSLVELVGAISKYQLEYQHIILENKQVIRISLREGINGIISIDTTPAKVAQLAFIQKNVDLASFDQHVQVIDVRYRLPVLRTTNTW
ncbi:MAG TPA: hypothetical protein VF209_00915 [Patescibacteria group bacterium]